MRRKFFLVFIFYFIRGLPLISLNNTLRLVVSAHFVCWEKLISLFHIFFRLFTQMTEDLPTFLISPLAWLYEVLFLSGSLVVKEMKKMSGVTKDRVRKEITQASAA